MSICPFCSQECETYGPTHPGNECYACKNCGVFEIHRDTKLIPKEQWDADKYIIAGYLFETNRRRWLPSAVFELKMIKTDIMDEIRHGGYWPLTTMQRLEKMLLYLYSLHSYVGGPLLAKDIPPPVAYAKHLIETISILDAMEELHWLVQNKSTELLFFMLTISGLTHAEELLRTNLNSTSVFIAMAFKKDWRATCDNAIIPACAACGFMARPSTDNEYNDGIMDEIITEIRRSKFVIVDFTYNNNGAYFEAGYAQGLGREIIRLCKKDWFEGHDEKGNKNRLHFDIQHYNIILWDNHADLLKKLKARIRATIPDAILED